MILCYKSKRMFQFNRQLLNVLHLSCAGLVSGSAYLTITNMSKAINSSIMKDNPDYNVDGYKTSSVQHLTLALFMWFVPSILATIGTRASLAIGSMCMTFNTLSMVLEIDYLTYIGSFIVGIGGSLNIVTMTNYVIQNSDPDTLSRNISIYWSLHSLSLIVGNLLGVFILSGKKELDYITRHELLYVFSGLTATAVILFLFVGQPVRYTSPESRKPEDALQTFKKTWQIFLTKDMVILASAFIYVGCEYSFGKGAFLASIGFTQKFGDRAKQFLPLSGSIYGAGTVLGGASMFLLPKFGIILSKKCLMISGFLVQLIACCLTFINIPDDAVFGDTNSSAIIEPNIWLALFCSFFLGLGDSCINTQVLAIIGALQPDHSAQACAVYKFIFFISTTLFFWGSSQIGLNSQLIIITVVGALGTSAFTWVDIRSSRDEKINF